MELEAWPRYEVDDLIARGLLDVGDGYRAKRVELDTVGLPFARAGNINHGFHFDGAELLGWEGVRAARQKVSRPGDVVFTSKGTVGRFALVRSDTPRFVYSPQLCFWRSLDDSSLDSRFLFCWMNSREFLHQVAAVKGQTDMAEYVSLRDQRRMRVTAPPIAEQRRIAAILGALDDKIELHRKMNRTLEEMAQALFKSWFIDFDGHDDLVDSEIGPIPRGWGVVPLAQTGRWVSGGTPSKKNPAYWNGCIPWFSAKSLGPLWLSDSDDRVTAAGADAGTRRVPRRSVLFLVRGMSLATEWRIGITSREATLNQDLKAIVDDGTVLPELTLLWLLANRELVRAKADEAGHGTKRLPTEVLHAHAMAVPPRAVQERVAAPLVHLLARIEQGLGESATLAALRHTLLPKLISGELRVPEAELEPSA